MLRPRRVLSAAACVAQMLGSGGKRRAEQADADSMADGAAALGMQPPLRRGMSGGLRELHRADSAASRKSSDHARRSRLKAKERKKTTDDNLNDRIFLVHTMPRRSNQLGLTVKTLAQLKAERRPQNLPEMLAYLWKLFQEACTTLVSFRCVSLMLEMLATSLLSASFSLPSTLVLQVV